jgi:dihydroxyacetone kinase-like protein
MSQFMNRDGKFIVEDLIRIIQENAAYLDDMDGVTGDGDHGINMNKGFTLCAEELAGEDLSFSSSLEILGQMFAIEVHDIAGPLYGAFFLEMALAARNTRVIDKDVFGKMLETALGGVQDIGCAKLGDKTILDTLIPAVEAYNKSKDLGFRIALMEMSRAAEKGKESTRDMVDKDGRASRFGEKSRGYLDPGATSCWLILESLADSILSVI